MSTDLYVSSQSHEMIFCMMNRGLDDKDDDPCLSKALLQVSDEFDSLSCLCDSFILVALALCTTSSEHSAPSGQTHILNNLLQLLALAQQYYYCTVNFFVGSMQWHCYYRL